jgi:tetratricopeptide (TPR) repeat protein
MSICRFVFVFLFFSLSSSRFLSAIPAVTAKPDQSATGQQTAASPPSGGTEKSQAPATLPTDVESDYSKEPFVVEKLQERYLFENDGTGRKVVTLRVHVLSDAGVQGFGQLRFGYNSANDRMEIGYVRVIKPDGKVITAGADAVQELSGVVQQNAPVYTDYREKHVTVPGLRPGDVMECEVTTIFHTAMAPGQFWMEHDFNLLSIVLDEKLEIDVPIGRTIKLKTKPGADPKITEENGRHIYRWETSHLVREDVREDTGKPDKKKKSKAKADKFPDVQLTTFGSWEEVGRWYAGLEKERRVPSGEVRAKAAELTRGLNSDVEKTEALYDFVAKDFRYVSLSLGLARYQPQAAGDVLRNQYGDCKDKNTLLAALLEAEGLHSSTVLINSARKLDPDVPAPSQFNHVITKLPLGKEDLWMDTTTEVAPFQLLSYQLRKKQALVIPEGGVPHLEETPADSPVPDQELTEVTGEIDDTGKLEATVKYTLRGDAELRQRLIFRRIAAAQWQKYIEGLNKSIGGSVSNVKVGDPSATREPFTIAYDVSKASFADWTKKKIQLKLPLGHLNLASVSMDIGSDSDTDTDKEGEDEDSAASNTENFKLGPRNESTYRLKLELAPRYTADVPVPTALDRDYGAYQSTYKFEANTFTAERKLTIRKAELPPARADDYRSFRQAALADAAQHLTLQSASADLNSVPTGMKAAELARSGNEARKNGNYTLAIDLLNHATEADPKSRAAWNELGIAYFDDQQDGLAINAFQKQIAINPYHDNAYDNLGRVYLRERKYDEAEKWFLKQLEIQPLHQHALTNLGIAYLETHKYGEALPYLEKAASLALDDATCQVRLGQAYLNLGQDDKAMAAFDKAVKISATPEIWNAIAYQLTLKSAHLDLARQYAESAVSGTSARLRNVSLDQIKRRDLSLVSSLESYWDTLGWVAFAEGKLDSAENYIAAAWQLGMRSDEADHLAQIYEKQGRKEEAQHLYAAALNARRPEPETRTRLAALAGGEAKADAMVEKSRNDLLRDRTIQISNPSKLDGNADFFILQSAGHGSTATLEDVTFVRGNERLKALTDELRGFKFSQKFPDDTPVKIVRRGTLSCKPDTCAFQLALPEDVKSVD